MTSRPRRNDHFRRACRRNEARQRTLALINATIKFHLLASVTDRLYEQSPLMKRIDLGEGRW